MGEKKRRLGTFQAYATAFSYLPKPFVVAARKGGPHQRPIVAGLDSKSQRKRFSPISRVMTRSSASGDIGQKIAYRRLKSRLSQQSHVKRTAFRGPFSAVSM